MSYPSVKRRKSIVEFADFDFRNRRRREDIENIDIEWGVELQEPTDYSIHTVDWALELKEQLGTSREQLEISRGQLEYSREQLEYKTADCQLIRPMNNLVKSTDLLVQNTDSSETGFIENKPMSIKAHQVQFRDQIRLLQQVDTVREVHTVNGVKEQELRYAQVQQQAHKVKRLLGLDNDYNLYQVHLKYVYINCNAIFF